MRQGTMGATASMPSPCGSVAAFNAAATCARQRATRRDDRGRLHVDGAVGRVGRGAGVPAVAPTAAIVYGFGSGGLAVVRVARDGGAASECGAAWLRVLVHSYAMRGGCGWCNEECELRC